MYNTICTRARFCSMLPFLQTFQEEVGEVCAQWEPAPGQYWSPGLSGQASALWPSSTPHSPGGHGAPILLWVPLSLGIWIHHVTLWSSWYCSPNHQWSTLMLHSGSGQQSGLWASPHYNSPRELGKTVNLDSSENYIYFRLSTAQDLHCCHQSLDLMFGIKWPKVKQ